MLLSPNLTVKQEQFDDVSMNAIEEPAHRSFLPSEESVILSPYPLPNLASSRPIACANQNRTRDMESTNHRRLRRSRLHLEAWWEANPDDRYPSREVTCKLAAKENLGFEQVKGWFVRKRKRMENASTTSPIERYTITPPREECSTIQTLISIQNDGDQPRFTKRSTSQSNIRYSTVNGSTVLPQVIDRESGTALGHNMSFSKTSSLHPSQDMSVLSGGKPTLPRRQKGKKVASQKQYAPERQANKILQCTRCNIGYQFRCDWARHLEIHEPQQQWTCMLGGATAVVQGKLTCIFCGALEPTPDHLIEHNVRKCADMPHDKRTFQRKDHMLGHINRVHKSKVQNPPDAWRTVVQENPNQQFWCGFCHKFLRTTWDSHVEHLFSHFKVDDFDMTMWTHERICLPSLPDNFAPLVSPTHSVDPDRPTSSINPRSGFHKLNSTPPMSSLPLGPGFPMGPPASTDPAHFMSPAPPTSPNDSVDIDDFLENGCYNGLDYLANPTLPYFNDDPVPDQCPPLQDLDPRFRD